MIEMPKDAFSPERLHEAYLKCRKGKRGAVNTRGFEASLYREIVDLARSLQDGSYRPSRSVCFYVKKPKLREVFAADFRDRVVHRLIVDILEPYYERSFIYDSWACRTGKGTHGAVRRLKEFVRRGTAGAKGPLYYLQLDIKGFFMSIHKEMLFSILAKRVASKKLLDLCGVIIRHDPTSAFVFKGEIPPPGVLPPHKTLFHADKEAGVPIGNLTSQFFANVYLNELDQYIKRGLGVKFYLRYVDDFVLLHRSPDELVRLKLLIRDFLSARLVLSLKDPAVAPVSVYKGIDFLGYFVKPRYTLVRRRVMQNYRKALFESLPMRPVESGHFKEVHLFERILEWRRLQARLNSCLAHFKQANARSVEKKLSEHIRSSSCMLQLREGYLRLPRVDRFPSLKSQISFLEDRLPGLLLIVQTGTFYRLYGREAANAGCSARLYSLRSGRGRRTKEPTFGMPIRDIKRKNRLMRFIQKNFVSYAVVRETGDIGDHVRVRLPAYYRQLLRPVQLELFGPIERLK